MKGQSRTVSILALIALVVAFLRYFMKGWVCRSVPVLSLPASPWFF